MDPFKERPEKIEALFTDREKNYPKPYDKTPSILIRKRA